MAETWFTPKEWKARLVEFAGRRLLRNVANGQSATYDVSRSEGLVSQEGDAFNTKNMNDLEQRISNGFANAKTNIDALNRDLNAINDSGAIKGMDAREDGVYITYSPTGGADTVTKKLGSFQRKLLGRVTSSTTFDCKSIPGWEDFTENNFAIIPVKIDATGGQWKSGATAAGGAQQGGCTPILSYDKVNGILKVSNFSWNNDYAYGSYWTNYCHGNMTADVYCYHF